MGDAQHTITAHVRGDGASRRGVDPVDALLHDLCALGPRPSGSQALARARDVLQAALTDTGALPYLGDDLTATNPSGGVNLLGVIPGRVRECRPLLLTTHVDGPAESPGAGDNGAAVAALVSVVGRLSERALERDVIVALVDGGDPSARPRPAPGRRRSGAHDDAHGLAAFLRHQRRHDLKAVVLVDRVGHQVDAAVAPPLLVIGAESEARLPSLLASLPAALPGCAALARTELAEAPAADALRTQGLPYLWLTAGRTPWHRGPGDTPERLHRPSLDAVVDLLIALIQRLSQTRLPGPVGEHDLADFRRSSWSRWAADDGDGAGPARRTVQRRLGWS